MMNSRNPCSLKVSWEIIELWPVERITGMSDRLSSIFRVHSIPDMWGMVWSVMIRSKSSGRDRKVSRALRLSVDVVIRYPSHDPKHGFPIPEGLGMRDQEVALGISVWRKARNQAREEENENNPGPERPFVVCFHGGWLVLLRCAVPGAVLVMIYPWSLQQTLGGDKGKMVIKKEDTPLSFVEETGAPVIGSNRN